jgi:hypothetical protein
MNPTEAEVMRILANAGYEARLAGDHVEILGRSGRELCRVPLQMFQEDDFRSVLPADLLDRD